MIIVNFYFNSCGDLMCIIVVSIAFFEFFIIFIDRKRLGWVYKFLVGNRFSDYVVLFNVFNLWEEVR